MECRYNKEQFVNWFNNLDNEVKISFMGDVHILTNDERLRTVHYHHNSLFFLSKYLDKHQDVHVKCYRDYHNYFYTYYDNGELCLRTTCWLLFSNKSLDIVYNDLSTLSSVQKDLLYSEFEYYI